MRKIILQAVLMFCAFLCASIEMAVMAESAQERNEIDFESVKYVAMTQNSKEGKRIRLSNSQARELSKRWNQARPIGLCKFYAKYIIYIHGKNGETRTFRATEDTMKEENDYCFVLERGYVGTVWNSKQ